MTATGEDLARVVNCFTLKLFMQTLHCSLNVHGNSAATRTGRFITKLFQKYLSDVSYYHIVVLLALNSNIFTSG